MKENEMSKEEIKELAKDMKPVIESMEEVLKKHDIKCLTSMTMGTDGYFNFSLHDSDWEFKRLNSGSKALISMNIVEEV